MEKILFFAVLTAGLIDLVFLVPKYTGCKYDHTPRKRKLLWKGISIGVAFLILTITLIIGIFNSKSDAVLVMLEVGMLFCAIGDIVLEIKFIRGAAFFLLGHLVYSFAALSLNCFNPVGVFVFFAVSLAGILLTKKYLGKKFKIQLLSYNFVISLSFSLGLSLGLSGPVENLILGIGLCFLGISDWILARNKVFKSNFKWSLLALEIYFGGQVLIAVSQCVRILS